MRVLYITWGEEIVQSGIFRNQVLNQLSKITTTDTNIEIRVVSGIPVITGGFVKHPIEYLRKLNKLKKTFTADGIQLSTIWLYTLTRWFVTKKYQTISFRFPGVFFLFFHILFFKPNIIHCRSYHPASIITLFKRLGFFRKIKFVFDPRSLFPEEGVLLNRYIEDSEHYKNWKKKELDILRTADCVVCVSDNLRDHYERIFPSVRYETIFTSADTTFFKNSYNLRRSSRQAEGLDDNTKVLVYSGDLSSKGWYSPEALGRLYLAFKTNFNQTKLVIVSASNSLKEAQFLSMGIANDEIIIKVGTTREKVRQALAMADYAANAYKKIRDEHQIENIISHTIIASKTGEYLSMGLPVLVNDRVGAATQFINEHRLGISYSYGKEKEALSHLKIVDTLYKDYAQRCEELADLFFSANQNAKKYIAVYQDLLP